MPTKKAPSKKAHPQTAGGAKESRELKKAKTNLEKIRKMAAAILKLTGGTHTPGPTVD